MPAQSLPRTVQDSCQAMLRSLVAEAPRLVPPIMHYRWLQRPIIDGGGVAVEHSDDADPPGDMRLISAAASGPSASISKPE